MNFIEFWNYANTAQGWRKLIIISAILYSISHYSGFLSAVKNDPFGVVINVSISSFIFLICAVITTIFVPEDFQAIIPLVAIFSVLLTTLTELNKLAGL